MSEMESDSVDLVFGSPPYSEQRKYLEKGKDLNISRKLDDWIRWMIQVYHESLRVSKGLVAYVIGHGQGAYTWNGAPMILGTELLKQGVNLLSPAWYKRSGIMGSGCAKWLRADLEWILCATKIRGQFYSSREMWSEPKYPAGGIPSHYTKNGERINRKALAQELGLGKKRKSGKVSGVEGGARVSRGIYVSPEKVNPGNVIDCGVSGGGHIGSNIGHEGEASFPEQLAKFFVRSYCPLDGTVLDPFMGTGTTLAVCVQHDRKFIGIDLRNSQIQLQRRRLGQSRTRKGFL